MFATHDIKFGIFSERPLTVTPAAGLFLDQLPKGYNIKQAIQDQLDEIEKDLEKLVGMMSDEDQMAYRDLKNDHKHDGSGPLLSIERTNRYGVARLRESPGVGSYGAVCKLGSRINHR